MNVKIYLENLGCAKNRVDSEIMLGVLAKNGAEIVSDAEASEILIINTCGFIASAVNESLDRVLTLSKIKEIGPPKKLIVVGCLSERYREDLKKEIPEIDILMGTSDYSMIVDAVKDCQRKTITKNYLDKSVLYSNRNYESERLLTTKHHYAYLKIAEGCSNMCSFCNIPKLRGRYQSRSIESVEKEFSQIIQNGVKEINLISQDCSSYGRDLKEDVSLMDLVDRLLEVNSEEFWIRIFYTYPNHYPVDLFKMMREDSRLVPYIDIPFQHISDPVLKSMNRRITEVEIENLINDAITINGDIAIRTTFLVGFPNETEKDFQKLLAFVNKGYFQHIGVFEYSHEDNIKSYQMDDNVPAELKAERKKILMEAQQRISLKKNQAKIGQIQKVLVEGFYDETDLLVQGRNQYQGVDVDGVVLINEGGTINGEFCNVEIIEAHPYDLIGKVVL